MAEPRGAAGRRGSTTRGAFALRSSAARCARVGFGLAIALLACARCVAAVADPTGRDRCDAPIDGTGPGPATCDAGDAVATDADDRRLTGVSTTAEFLRDRYVVRFDDYRPIEAHYDALVRALGPPLNADDGVMGEPSTDDTPDDDDVGESGSTAPRTAPPTAPSDQPLERRGVRWRWVVRDNPATRKFPTDFAVIAVDDDEPEPTTVTTVTTAPTTKAPQTAPPTDGRARALLLLAAASGVRDARREQRLVRSLAWERADAPANDDGGADSGGADSGDVSRHGGGGGPSPGRLRTRPTIGMEPPGYAPDLDAGGLYHDDKEFGDSNEDEDGGTTDATTEGGTGRSLLAARHVVDAFDAAALWREGFSGKGVKTGVFDTGVRADHPHFRKIKERTNWTHERTLNDGLGHGTFVAGVVASQDGECPGFAPDAEIHTFRVFTNDQVSYTSWFLDAFNYAIATEVNVINLSIGGPDYLDLPFVEKIDEIVANGIIMVSAIGNDGPLYGTLNNPADQLDVIGVGGVDYRDKIASFSSRGMSTHELPHGYGRVKPDVVAYGRDVMGSKIAGGCRSLSGTSVASPVVAGAVTLLASVVPIERRWKVLNPGVMKQALVEGADVIPGGPMIYEQGAGKLNLHASREILRDYAPRASLVPGRLDFTACPYMWPHCRQALYHGAMPFMFNATVVNGMGLTGWLEAAPVWTPGGYEIEGDDGDDGIRSDDLGKHLDVRFEFSDVLWPYSGYLAFYARVKKSASGLEGVASGVITFTVLSPPGPDETTLRRSTVRVPVKFQVIKTPPREKRVLWSQYHSVRYPPGYVPRDNLDAKNDILDWHGDHPHTNYHGMYDALRDKGYFLEILGSPLTCFDAARYGALMLVDAEEEYSEAEVKKLRDDVVLRGLGVFVVGDWYNVKQMESMRFFDDNTHSHWTPVTGGANVPALNDLLKPFGFAFGDRILHGAATLNGQAVAIASGANIARVPAGAFVHKGFVADKAPKGGGGGKSAVSGGNGNKEHVVAAFFQVPREGGRAGDDSDDSRAGSLGAGSPAGRLAIYGDSNCLDSSHTSAPCFPFLANVLEFLTENERDTGLTSDKNLASEPYDDGEDLPTRRTDVDFDSLSTTMGGRPGNEGLNRCGPNSPMEFWQNIGGEKIGLGGHPDAKTAIGWSETRAESAMREAKRRLDAVLKRRESLVNVGGSSPASVERYDDSFSDADGGSHHALRANTRPNDDDPRTNDEDYDADAGPFDDAKRRTPSRVTRHGGFDPATPSIDSGDFDRSGGGPAAWVALALFAAFAALVIRRVRRRRRGGKRREGSSPLASRLARRHAL